MKFIHEEKMAAGANEKDESFSQPLQNNFIWQLAKQNLDKSKTQNELSTFQVNTFFNGCPFNNVLIHTAYVFNSQQKKTIVQKRNATTKKTK